jgi:hypothetical protein
MGRQRIVKKLLKERQIGCQKDVERASRWRQKRRGEKVKNERKRDGKEASKTLEKGCRKSGKGCRERKTRVGVSLCECGKVSGRERPANGETTKRLIVRRGASNAT